MMIRKEVKTIAKQFSEHEYYRKGKLWIWIFEPIISRILSKKGLHVHRNKDTRYFYNIENLYQSLVLEARRREHSVMMDRLREIGDIYH